MTKTHGPLEPWHLIPLLDGRSELHFWVLKTDMNPARRIYSSYLIWLARRYGYAFSSAVSVRSAGLPVPRPAFKVTLVRDDSPAGIQRARETRQNFPFAGHGGQIPGLTYGGAGADLSLANEITTEVAVWERILIHDALRPTSETAISLYVLALAAIGWLAYTLGHQPEQFIRAIVAACASTLFTFSGLAIILGHRRNGKKIEQAGFTKIHPPGRLAYYVNSADTTTN
ncbi:hypothetical protein [Streptomyces sp. Da 82-17]|uniref:hypothetical protein n=1 Tax=Streptomyces sp. Da 82-17 TaxID=3377116 RepID=UPI0038D470F4